MQWAGPLQARAFIEGQFFHTFADRKIPTYVHVSQDLVHNMQDSSLSIARGFDEGKISIMVRRTSLLLNNADQWLGLEIAVTHYDRSLMGSPFPAIEYLLYPLRCCCARISSPGCLLDDTRT